MAENVQPYTPAEFPEAQANYFEERYRIEREIVDLTEKHLADLKADRSALIADFKARSGIKTKVTNAAYVMFKLEREGETFTDEADAEIRKIDLERTWSAVKKGHTLNFIDAIEIEGASVGESPLGGDDGDDGFTGLGHFAGGSEEERAPSKKALTGKKREPKAEPAPPPEAHAAYGSEEQAQAGHEDFTDNEGELFDDGYRFGLGGNLDIASMIKAKGINPNGPGANAMRAGHTKGFDEFTVNNPPPAQTVGIFGDDGAEDEISLAATAAQGDHHGIAAQ